MRTYPLFVRRLIIGVVLILGLSCTIPVNLPGPSGESGPSQSQQTRIALGIQATLFARGRTATEEAESYKPTPSATEELPTQAAPPTDTPEIEGTPTSEPTPEPYQTPTVNVEEIVNKIYNANILVYEDSWGSYDMYGYALDKRIDDALDELEMTGDNVVRVHDALGDFFSNLNSSVEWDLIIVAAENRNFVRGEIWDPIYELAVEKNTAVIAELWYLDQIAYGRINPFMDACGIAFHKDWLRINHSDLNNFIVFWHAPEHSIFHQPYELTRQGMLVPSSNYDLGVDYGDLLKITGGDAVLLAGTQQKELTTYGTIAECMEGRVIFQTLSTHHYKRDDMVPLWQNYIIYTLTKHFISQ